MNKAEELIKYGYSIEELNELINSGKISFIKNELFINEFNTLLDIIKKTDDSFVLRHYCELQVNFKLYELFRLIRLGKNEMAYKLAERIYKTDKIPEVKLIIDNLTYTTDNIKYIIEEDRYDNKEVVKKYKQMELDMLLDFYCGDLEKGGEKIAELFSLYLFQNPIDFKAYIAYLEKIDDLKIHHTKINKRKNEGAMGDPLAIVTALLISEDFYRAHNVLKEYYLNNMASEFSVIWEILRLFDIKLMILLKENTRNVERIIDLNSNGLNNEEEIIKDYQLSYLSDDCINKLQKIDESVDEKINYFKLYGEYKEQHKYKEAKDAIIKYQFITDRKQLGFKFDYLIYELDILEENYKNCDKLELNIRDRLIDEGDNLLNNRKYKEAIEKFKESLKYEKHKSPSTLSKIGECYLKLGKYFDAFISYRLEERDFLYPDDYINIIECLYRLKITDKATRYVNKYEEYFPESSSFIHYILSLIHLENKNYKEAASEISMCEIIDQEETGLPLTYCYERNIIHSLMNGKEVEPYVLESYYDHTYSTDVIESIFDLDIDSLEEGELIDYIKDIKYGDSLEDMIDYLLTLYKILKEMDRRNDAKDLLVYLEEIIQSPNISQQDKNNFTLVLKNYRTL